MNPHAALAATALALCTALVSCVTASSVDPVNHALDESALGLSQTALPAVDEAWWKTFGDPQLDALVADALEHSPRLDEALARVRGAQAQAIAAGAPLHPSLTLDGEELRQRLSANYLYPPKDLGIGPGGGGTYWTGDFDVNLRWDLDFWDRQASILQGAEARTRASGLDAAAARLALAGSIARAYIDLSRAYAMADLATQTEAQRQSLLRIAQGRFEAGLGTRFEVRRAEALVPQAHLDRLQAEATRVMAVHQLAALAGRGATDDGSIGRPTVDADAALPLPTTLPMDLLAHRPDVLASRLRVEAATADRTAAHAAFYPDISLRAFVGLQAIGLGNLFESDSRAYGAGPAIHLPIFEARRLKAGYLGATADLDTAIASYNDTVLNAVREVADEISRTDILRREQVEAVARLGSSDAAWTLAKHQYTSGLVSQVPVLDAEAQVLSARRDIIDLDSQLLVTRVSLLLRVGGSFQPPAPSDSTAPEGAPEAPRS